MMVDAGNNLFSATNRHKLLEKIRGEVYDLIVIGGGITGSGIALDAATRGLRTLLIEKDDFASGTSSKSTKLIHGGLRYLKQFEIALVREVGRERAIVHSLAPHLVKSEKMLLPLIKDGTFGKIITSLGLMVYDVLAGVEKADQRKMYDKEETMRHEPLLRSDDLEGGGIYAEYRTDDARLTVEVIKTAVHHGADAINYCEALDFLYDDSKVTGVKFMDNLSLDTHTVSAKYVVSAAGPWVDSLRKTNRSFKGKKLRLTKGVHIVVPYRRLPIKQSVYFDVPDGRMIFAIPRDRITYIGTTDTDYTGDLNDVRTDMADVKYLLDGANHMFPSAKLTVKDVESSWAGLRPLIEEEGKSASELSRKDEIFLSDTGLISIAGGKLTGYRKMAERILDLLNDKMEQDYDVEIAGCVTDKVVLMGGPFKNANDVEKYENGISKELQAMGIDGYYGSYLVANYGKQSRTIIDKIKDFNDEDAHVRLARAELWFAVHYEMTCTAVDFFNRRTGRLYFNLPTVKPLIKPILSDLKDYLGWDNRKLTEEESTIQKAVAVTTTFE